MKVTENEIVFENQREKEILLMILQEVNMGELRPEIHDECANMFINITTRLAKSLGGKQKTIQPKNEQGGKKNECEV